MAAPEEGLANLSGNYDRNIREIFQVVGARVAVRAAIFRWDFLSVMRPNSFAVGA
jgi:hypothetical protein